MCIRDRSNGDLDAPADIAARVPEYMEAIEKMRTTDFADHQTLIELAERLRLSIHVVKWNWSYTIDHAEQSPARTIVLGNDNYHYVWLAQPHELGPRGAEAQDHELETHSADAQGHEIDLRGTDALCARIRPVFAPGVDYVSCPANIDKFFNGHGAP